MLERLGTLVPSGFHMVSDIPKADVSVDKYFYQVAYLSITSLINERQYIIFGGHLEGSVSGASNS